MATSKRVVRDEPIDPSVKPPEVPKATAEALRDGKQVFVIAPRHMIEPTPGVGYPMRKVLERACGGPEGVAKCKPKVVSSMRWLRLRSGDRVIVAVPCVDYPYEYGHTRLSEPINVDDCWDVTGDGNAGAVDTTEFFAAVARAAAPMTVKRREDNGTFEVMFA